MHAGTSLFISKVGRAQLEDPKSKFLYFSVLLLNYMEKGEILLIYLILKRSASICTQLNLLVDLIDRGGGCLVPLNAKIP